ncbi:MAG: gamma-glutamylcyclotransferase [Bacteroidota bacterium]
MGKTNYIFGYGSLIEKESRMRTTPEAQIVHPVIVKGFKRGWFARTGVYTLSTTFLGCVSDENALVNGVIYKISDEDLPLLDKREANYKRKLINPEKIEFLSDLDDLDCAIWVYTNTFTSERELLKNVPDKNFPIVQSYVDICINGCLEIEQEFEKAKEIGFAQMFIESTAYWNTFWANDRIYPRRPFIHRPNANTIDNYLKTYLQDKTLFDQIYIE